MLTVLRTPTAIASKNNPAPQPPTFLRPLEQRPVVTDFDTRQRFGLVSELLDRLLKGLIGPVSILDVGCNVLNMIPDYFDPNLVRVTRCDVYHDSTCDPDYVQVVPGEQLPFPDYSFDVVASLEVLEHLPPAERAFFMKECLRVSRRGAVWSCPNGVPDVIAAELAASQAYAFRHGQAHPFLQEHADFGLPTREEIRGHLAAFDVPHSVWQQNPLDVWLASQLLGDPLKESCAPNWILEQLSQSLVKHHAESKGPRPVCYRNVFVAAKTFDATEALESFPTEFGEFVPSDSHSDTLMMDQDVASDGSAMLVGTTRIAAKTVADITSTWRRELKYRDQDIARHGADRKRSHEETEAVRRELHAWNQRSYILLNDIRLLTGTLSWRLSYPLRYLTRCLSPQSFTDFDLKPWFELKPTNPGEWKGTGTAPLPREWESLGFDPQFVLPVVLPKGYCRIEMKISGQPRGMTELYADEGEGFTASSCIDSFEWEESLTVDIVVNFETPVLGLRLDPLCTSGAFQLHYFRVTPLAGPRILAHALAKKIELLKMYRLTGRTLGNGLKMLFTGQFFKAFGKLTQTFADDRRLGSSSMASRTSYDVWRRRREITEEERNRQRTVSKALANPTTFSIVMPVYNPPPDCLEKAIQSVRKQTYPHWQLCIVDDKSTDSKIASILRKHANADSRIHVTFAEKNSGIAAASNRALTAANGDFMVLFDHDDELAEHALYKMDDAIRANPKADFVYSDEDKITPEGTHIDPFFKPDWSPDFFLTCMYTCHLGAYRRSVVERVGGFRSEFDTAQDYDLALRIVADIQLDAARGGPAETEKIVHIPDILYHWRMLPQSTASSARAKPKAEETARKALAAYLDRVGKPGTVERGSAVGLHRVRYEIKGRPKVSIVIPTAGRRSMIRGKETWYALHCVRSIRESTTYDNYDILVVDNNDLHPQLARELQSLGVIRVPFTEPFNLSAKINLGAERATGEYLILLNDDTEVMAPDWIESMLEVGQWPEVGAVGAKLLFEDGRLQHAGVTFVGGIPCHHFYAAPGDYPGYWHGNLLVRNYSAVTGACVLVRKTDYQKVGGFDPSFPLNYNDIDMCLKLRRLGKRIVYQPNALLAHFENASKDGTFPEEFERFHARWGKEFDCDPYYNPNLTKIHGDYRLGAGIAGE
ncbi:MAG: glycosyltransferase [Gemmataceae bacterium]